MSQGTTTGSIAIVPSIDTIPTNGSANPVSSNGVFDALETKLTKNTWIDYSATSTTVGWSSFTTKEIWILIIGDTLFCQFSLVGTSNSTTTSFTINNNNPNSSIINVNTYVTNAGATQTGPGRIAILNGSNVVVCTTNAQGTLYSATGNKQAIGQFTLKIV